MSITAIIVNYKTDGLTAELVKLLRGESSIAETIVVDNSGSFHQKTTDIRTLKPDSNIGYGRACNMAIQEADTPLFLLLNPDVRPLPDCIPRLINAALTHGAALAGPRSYLDDDKVFRMWPAQGASLWMERALTTNDPDNYEIENLGFYWALRHSRHWSQTAPFVEPFIPGACMLVDRKKAVGEDGKLFDEDFFLYYEDTDLCLRMSKAGSPPLCVPGAEVIHYYDQSEAPSEQKNRYMMESAALYFRKHYGISLEELGCSKYDSNAAPLQVRYDIQLGNVQSPPQLSWSDLPQSISDPLFLEVSPNPSLIPFAQAEAGGDSFKFPSAVWKRLRKGNYLARLRSEAMGDLKRWRWYKE